MILGVFFARKQGFRNYAEMRIDITKRTSTREVLLDGICVMMGGILLILPGFISDIMGLISYCRQQEL